MELYQVKLDLTPLQMKKLMKKKPVQVKKSQLDNGKILISLNKDNWKRYKRAKSRKSGFRIVADDRMIEGSGFADILKGLKSGASKVASVAVPYVKNLAKSLLPKVRGDIDAGLNSGVDYVANKVRSTLSPIIGDDVASELVNQGTASVKGFAKDKLDQVQGALQGMGLKRGPKYHYKMAGGKLSLNFAKIAEVLKPIAKIAAKIAAPALASSVGGPAAGVAASMVADSLLGEGAPPRLYLGRPGATDADKKRLNGRVARVIPAPKRAARGGRKKKINGSALMPMGKGRGGALFPM